jgi:hypothetical protein
MVARGAGSDNPNRGGSGGAGARKQRPGGDIRLRYGFVESFNGKFRDECLSAELFWSQEEARVIVEDWRRQYNRS